MSQRDAKLIYHDPPCTIQDFEHACSTKGYNPATLQPFTLRSNRNPLCHSIHTRANMLVISMSGFCFSLENDILDMIQVVLVVEIKEKEERMRERGGGVSSFCMHIYTWWYWKKLGIFVVFFTLVFPMRYVYKYRVNIHQWCWFLGIFQPLQLRMSPCSNDG